jgi:monolysocardiolipin acyltransferase
LFFTIGQVLPAHRSSHSPHGGPFQATMAQAIRLLSAPASTGPPRASPYSVRPSVADPFSSGALTYTTTGGDAFPVPSAYRSNRHAWIHIFPEGCVHQHPTSDLRYFKWGVSRLVLESEPAPAVVPMFIDGMQHVMPEDRVFPRFLPRVGARIRVAFGEAIDGEAAFGDLRHRWRGLVAKSRDGRPRGEEDASARALPEQPEQPTVLGELTHELKYGKEAEELRIEVARRVREEVLKVRRSLGYAEPDPRSAYAETWAQDSDGEPKYESRVDGSGINQD